MAATASDLEFMGWAYLVYLLCLLAAAAVFVWTDRRGGT